jgi:hypothetical protein
MPDLTLMQWIMVAPLAALIAIIAVAMILIFDS